MVRISAGTGMVSAASHTITRLLATLGGEVAAIVTAGSGRLDPKTRHVGMDFRGERLPSDRVGPQPIPACARQWAGAPLPRVERRRVVPACSDAA